MISKTFPLNGLTENLIKFFDFKTLSLNSDECRCTLNIQDECFDKDGEFNDGLLTAIVDSFSSYAVKFFSVKEDYRNFLSVSIHSSSFGPFSNKTPLPITIRVKPIQNFQRNLLLEIRIFDGNLNLIKYYTHLKRKISAKL